MGATGTLAFCLSAGNNSVLNQDSQRGWSAELQALVSHFRGRICTGWGVMLSGGQRQSWAALGQELGKQTPTGSVLKGQLGEPGPGD